MSNDKKKEPAIWVDGLRIFEVKEGQGRSWGIGDIVIDPDVFIAWLHKQPRREDGAVRIAVNLSEPHRELVYPTRHLRPEEETGGSSRTSTRSPG